MDKETLKFLIDNNNVLDVYVTVVGWRDTMYGKFPCFEVCILTYDGLFAVRGIGDYWDKKNGVYVVKAENDRLFHLLHSIVTDIYGDSKGNLEKTQNLLNKVIVRT